MHELASLNNKQLPTDSARIAAASAASLYGKGVFTTVAIFGGEPFLWEKHWRRLLGNAAQLDIDVGDIREDSVKSSLHELIRCNKVTNGRARITIFDETPPELWVSGSRADSTVLIMTGDRRRVVEAVKLAVSSCLVNSTSPLAGVKSSNYTEKIIVLAGARANGFDECVQLNERGEVTSAAMANLVWIKGEELFTPSLETGCLAGTTREYVIENFRVNEVSVDLSELRRADRIFLTSAGIGVAQASELDGINLAVGSHPIVDLLPRD